MKPYVVSIVLACFAIDLRVAHADRQTTAAVLFEKGIQDLQAGKTALACGELADSLSAWPDSGTKGALAECNTALDKTGSAWALWRDLAASAPTAALRDDAAANAAKLEPRLARVTLHLRGEAPVGLEVTIDGKLVSPQAIAQPVDPGPIAIRYNALGSEPRTRTIQAVEGTTIDVDLAVSAPDGDLVASRHRRRVFGVTLAGTGAVFLGASVVLGLVSRSDWHHAVAACGGNTDHCATEGLANAQNELSHARRAATLGDISLGLGAAAVVAGLALFVTAPHAEANTTALRVSPMASSHSIGVALSGALP